MAAAEVADADAAAAAAAARAAAEADEVAARLAAVEAAGLGGLTSRPPPIRPAKERGRQRPSRLLLCEL